MPELHLRVTKFDEKNRAVFVQNMAFSTNERLLES